MDNESIKEAIGEELKDAAADGAHVSVPLYESFKGKQMHASKSWKATDKEQKTVKVLGVIFTVLVILALAAPFLPISTGLKALLFVLAIVSGIGGMGGYLFFIAFRHHKEEPMEMHYYDVDYKQNYVTGNGYDNTKEISKEEFFGRDNGKEEM